MNEGLKEGGRVREREEGREGEGEREGERSGWERERESLWIES